MLRISEQAQGALRAQFRPAYIERLRVQLAEDYPHFLPRFPEHIGHQIVSNMLARAELWSLTHQRSYVMWCGWMITIAPNFDDEPEINAALRALPEPRDQGLGSIVRRVSPASWTRAEASASSLPFFIAPPFRQAPPVEQIVSALPLVLFGLPQASDPTPIAQQSIATVGAMGLFHIADAPLVIACCIAFWGVGWPQLPWARDLEQSGITGVELLAALRFRIALEFGRYV